MNNDRITVWSVVGSIILGFFVALLATVVFAWAGKEIPAPIGHLLDVSFGALATLLAQTRGEPHQQAAQPVPLKTVPGQPLEVTQVPQETASED